MIFQGELLVSCFDLFRGRRFSDVEHIVVVVRIGISGLIRLMTLIVVVTLSLVA